MSKGQQQLLQAALARRKSRMAQQVVVEDENEAEPEAEAEVVSIGDIVEPISVTGAPDAPPAPSFKQTPRPKPSTQRVRGNPSGRRMTDDVGEITGPLTASTPERQRPKPASPRKPVAEWHKSNIRERLSELFRTVRVGAETIVVFGPTGPIASADNDAILAVIEYEIGQEGLQGKVSTTNRTNRFRVTYLEEA
jgi:hypothetical protein